jgi:hypothetical protein
MKTVDEMGHVDVLKYEAQGKFEHLRTYITVFFITFRPKILKLILREVHGKRRIATSSWINRLCELEMLENFGYHKERQDSLCGEFNWIKK